jgi:hypothetical protein
MKGMMKKMRFCLILLFVLTLMVGCKPIPATVSQSTQSIETPTPSVTNIDLSTISANVTVYPVETPIPVATDSAAATLSYDPSVDPIILQAIKDLNQKTGVALEKIIVLEVEAVEWPDGSLGCGTPGTEYLQVITPGFHISLEAGGQVYSYHTDTTSQIMLCSQRPPLGIRPTP